MKIAARNLLIIILIFTIPACFSQNFIISADKMKDYDDTQIISIRTSDGRIIDKNSRIKLYNSPKGFYIADSSGTKFISHNDLESIEVKQFNLGNTVILAACIGAATYIGMFIYGLATLRLT